MNILNLIFSDYLFLRNVLTKFDAKILLKECKWSDYWQRYLTRYIAILFENRWSDKLHELVAYLNDEESNFQKQTNH